MTISNFCENKILDSVFNATSFSVATPFVKLHTGDPGEDGTGSPAGETTRKALSVAAASSGQVVSDADLTWASVSTSETLTHVSVWDASTGGNCLWSGPLTPSKVVTSGDDFMIPAGQWVAQLD